MGRKALGKGIHAIIPEEVKRVLEGELREIPASSISPNPYQPREGGEENLSELVASIKEKGILEPLIVRRKGEGYELVAGGRRLKAAIQAGLERVPVVIREATDSELLELALIENLQRKDLNPIEEASAYQRLSKEFGLTHEEIAKKVGKSRANITNTLRLLTLPGKTKRYLRVGKISAGHARALLSIPSPSLIDKLCDRIVREGLSVREIERLTSLKRKKRVEHPKDPHILTLEDSLSESLGTKVRIHKRGKKGRIYIEFYSEEDLERLISRIIK